MSEWKEYRLGDVTSWSSGGTPSKKNDDFWGGEIPWISASSMKGNRYSESELKITPEGLSAGSRVAEENTVLLLVRGSTLHQRILVGITERNVAFNQDVKAIKPKEELLDSWYLLFWFMSIERDLLNMVENTGIGAGKLDTKLLKNLIIKIPPKEERERIKFFAKAIDDKLILNHQTNQTLEQIAQAIFKSWFVDFEPTRAKIIIKQKGGDQQAQDLAAQAIICGAVTLEDLATFQLDSPPINTHLLGRIHAKLDVHGGTNAAGAGSTGAANAQTSDELGDNWLPESLAATAALFPNALIDSELGEIPEGWNIQSLEDVLELSYGKALKKTDRIEGKYPVYGSGGLTGYHNKALVDGPGIIVGRKGSVGTLYWEDSSFFPIDTVFYVIPKSHYSLEYIFYLLQTLGLENMNTDAAVPGLNRNNAYRLGTAKVPEDLVSRFSEILEVVRNISSVNIKESGTLEQLRDLLLPKLLSGELSVNDSPAKLESA